MTRFSTVAAATALVGLLALAAGARAATVDVAATTDIFLASQPNGASLSGFFGSDTVPDNSPVKFDVTAGATLTFAASGSTSVDGGCFAGPDGAGCYGDESGFSPPPASNTYKGPANALIGVFLGPGVTSVQDGPASLDYTDPANISMASLSPGLNEIFFIGDGLTGTGDGAVQQFIAPMGATNLYLAVADSIGSSTGNLGSLSVDYTGATLDAGAVPEPATWGLMLLGFGGLGATLRLLRNRPALA
jgi:hypothetical protein